MRRVTKENLIAQIDRLRKIKDEQGQLSMSGEYTLQAYEMLLATMDSEPVGEVIERPCSGEMNTSMTYRRVKGLGEMESMPVGTKFYAAQPALVVLDDVSIFEAAIEKCKTCDSIDEHAWNHGVLAVIAEYESCRTAMLNK